MVTFIWELLHAKKNSAKLTGSRFGFPSERIRHWFEEGRQSSEVLDGTIRVLKLFPTMYLLSSRGSICSTTFLSTGQRTLSINLGKKSPP